MYLSIKGILLRGCRPVSGVVGFSFSGLFSHASCLELLRADFKARRNGRWQVFLFLTNMRDVLNLVEQL